MAVPSGSESDGDLYKMSLAGDREATRHLVARHHAQLVLFVRAKTDDPGVAEDAAAEAWLRYFRHLNEVAENPDRALQKPESIRFWLYTTALNAMRDQFRSSSRQSAVSERITFEAEARGLTAYEPDELARLESDERRVALRAAFTKLDDRCRELLSLLSTDPPMSYREVAEIIGRPVGSLGPARQRCLSQLRRHMGVIS